MATDLMEVLRGKVDQVRDDVQSVRLKLEELWWRPSSDDWVTIDRLWIKVEEQGAQEALLHHDVVSLHILLLKADREDLSPEELFKLQILVSHIEDRLA